jgi:NitT/TauT family transport system ATP-binding protein
MTVVIADSVADIERTDPRPSRSPIVLARNLTRIFETASGPVTAIQEVSLSVCHGEFVAIVGPSGCGKTTLLRILAGLDRATSGDLDLADKTGVAPSSALVFQGQSVFPWMTVRENVEYGLKIEGRSRRERKDVARNLLSLVGLTRFARAYPHQLSEGMRQRTAIARALAVDPQLLLMDEPFGSLDEQTRFILQDELLRIWESTRKTIVLVTHSIDEALTLGDKVVVMTAGPGTIKATIPVNIDRPRNQATLRSNPAFANLFGDIWEMLRAEVQATRMVAGEVR